MVSPFVADTSVRETRQSTMNSTNRPPKERFQMDGLSHLTKIADGRNQSQEEKPAVSSEPKAKVSAYIHWAKPKTSKWTNSDFGRGGY